MQKGRMSIELILAIKIKNLEAKEVLENRVKKNHLRSFLKSSLQKNNRLLAVYDT